MRSLFLTFLVLVMTVGEAAGAQLSRITRSSTAVSLQIYAHFDAPPLYRERFAERRLDLIFLNSSVAEPLPTPGPDEAIVKTLVVQEQNDTILSLFFRYIPQDLSITGDPSGVVIIDLIAGNRFTDTYRELNSDLGFLSPVSRTRETFVNPLTFLPYRDDWQSFLLNFKSLPELVPAPQPIIPPFPLTSLLSFADSQDNQAGFAAIEGLSGLDRFEALRQIQKQLKTVKNNEEQKYYALAHADILFRLGSVDAALAQFNILAETFRHDNAGYLALYAAALIEAQKENYHLARVKLSSLLDILSDPHPLRAHVGLTLSETLLATGNLQKMEQLLETENFSSTVEQAITLRQADLAFATGSFEDAFSTYEAFSGTSLMKGRPYSVSAYCSLLFNRLDKDTSQQCYRDLATQLNNREEAARAFYLAALAAQDTSPSEETETLFRQIVEGYPETSAALRAEMKLADSCILSEEGCADHAVDRYRSIADRASERAIAEEASFKEALGYLLKGDQSTPIKLAQQLLRTFQSGKLRDHARALIIQLLPGEINHLLDEQRDIAAIALAQQNRTLFEKGWLNDNLLFRLSLAFQRLEMYSEALQLQLYLKKKSQTLAPEAVHFAILQSAHALGSHYLVEDLAAEYSYLFPEGQHQLDVLFYRLSCSYAVGKIDEALLLLPDPIPQRRDFRLLAAALNFHKKNYRNTVDLLLPIFQTTANVLSSDQLYMLAESLFELEETGEAEKLFIILAETDKSHQAARYRLVQLTGLRQSPQTETHTALPSADFPDSDPWHRFAAQDLRLKELMSNL